MNRIKELRELQNETLRDLSQKLLEIYNYKVSAGQLSNYENENRTPRDTKIWDYIANYYDVSVAFLLGYTTDPKRYEDEIILENQKKKVFAFSPKSVHGIEKEKINKEIIEALKNNAVIISDKNIEIILDFIDNNRLDNPNTYQGKDFTDKMFKYKDLNNLIFELKNNGFSTIFEDIEKED